MIDGTSMQLVLATKRRLNQIRGPLLEALDDANSGALGQELPVQWLDLRDAFVTLEATISRVRQSEDLVPILGQC